MKPVQRSGSAVLLVLAAAAVTGFLAIGALAAAAELHRQELTERAILQAELAAERAFAERVVRWEVRDVAREPAWRVHSTASPGAASRSLLQPAGPGLWRLTAIGERVNATATQPPLAARSRIAFLRARVPEVQLAAPLTAHGSVDVEDAGSISAAGTSPPGWTCGAGASASAVAQVALLPGGTLTGPTTPTSIPESDSAATALEHALSLASPPAPVALSPTILTGDLLNPTLDATGISPTASCLAGAPGSPLPELHWGDPVRPSECAGYLPYVRVGGSLTNPAGAGQGVLVVDGDLRIDASSPGFSWAGLIVVLGNLHLEGSSNRILGAVAALGPGPHRVLSGAEIAWSPCALESALRAGAHVTPVTGTPWTSP